MTTPRHPPALVFCLFKYFPYGGLERDMLAIATECHRRGYAVTAYTQSWQGTLPPWLDIHLLACDGSTNHGKARRFARQLERALAHEPADAVVGFNKMPGLDVYFAADVCYKEYALAERSWLYRLTGRYRQYRAFEEAVFGPDSTTHVLMISKAQESVYVRHYRTPEARIHFLPPGVSRDSMAPSHAGDVREGLRRELGLGACDALLLQVGSWFVRKGVDRSIRALAALPPQIREKTHLRVIGADKPVTFVRLAARLGVDRQVRFLGGRDDVPRFLMGADLLLHPAHQETTGKVIVEALAAGLPSVVSGVCGYAHYVQEARAGWVIPEPLDQGLFNQTVGYALAHPETLEDARRNALAFAAREDLYGMVDAAVAAIERVLFDKRAATIPAGCP